MSNNEIKKMMISRKIVFDMKIYAQYVDQYKI